MTVRYPLPLVPGTKIGVTAPSSGVAVPAHLARLDLVASHMVAAGYPIVEGACLRSDYKHVSAPAADRARDFTALWQRDDLRAIIPPWGGELLIEILPHLDFPALAAEPSPKWVLGYSDLSTLLFALTLKTGIATAHGANFMDLIRDQVFGLTQDYLKFLASEAGGAFTQSSYPRFQIGFTPFEKQVDAPFLATEPVRWEILGGAQQVQLQGRLIGGCLDTLGPLVGTPFGDLPVFLRTHRADGVVLYLENCEFAPPGVARGLWQMRLAGWFDGLAGIVLGRSNGPDKTGEHAYTYRDAVASVLSDLGIPVILDADIGHRPPQILLINGALATITVQDGRAEVRQELRP